MLNNKSQIKRRARRFFTQRACFSAVADCTSTISGASLFQSRVTTLPATLKTCSDLEDAAGMAKMTLKIGARMDNGLQKIIEKSVYCKVKIPNQNKTLTSALTYCFPRPALVSFTDPLAFESGSVLRRPWERPIQLWSRFSRRKCIVTPRLGTPLECDTQK